MPTYTNPKNSETITTNLTGIQAFDLLSNLPANKKNNFVVSILGAYGRLSPSQLFWFYKLAEDNNPNKSVAAPIMALASRMAPAPIRVTGDFPRIYSLFMAAKASGLQKPKLTLAMDNGAKVGLSLAGDRSANAGFIYTYYREVYSGKISPDGIFTPTRDCVPEMITYLSEFSNNPLAVAQAYGRRTGNCCCCNRLLTNAESVSLGIGPICRERWGM